LRSVLPQEALSTKSAANNRTYKNIDKKELTFLGDNRPACRYLFFRFVISYLYARINGNDVVREKFNRHNFWPTMGRYLHRSTLVTLARCFSGTELPPSLLETNTFEPDGEQDKQAGQDIGMLLGADIREALISSMEEREKEDEDEEETTDEEYGSSDE
jgi:hypothetical protein